MPCTPAALAAAFGALVALTWVCPSVSVDQTAFFAPPARLEAQRTASHSQEAGQWGVAAASSSTFDVEGSAARPWPRAASFALTCAAAAAAVAATSARKKKGSSRSRLRPRAAEVTEKPSAAPTLPPVWVVNLDKSVDRWRRCSQEMADHEVSAERFPATLGKAMSDEEIEEKVTFGARYFCTPGMIGCFMSHIRIWERTVKEGLPAVVALEDDVVLFPNFTERLQTLLKELPEDWDVCLLGAVGCISTDVEPLYMKLYGLVTGGGRPSPGKSRSISPNLYVPYRPAGTHAYMVSQRGAAKLLERCPKPRFHVDLTAWSLQDLNLYAAKEQLATQRFDDDTTVSKEGAPLTKRFLRWCWDFTGLAHMGRKGGLPNLTWAWTIACFALPVPFSKTRRRFIIEMGPASSIFVLIMLLCVPLKSFKPAGWALAYMASIICVIRWLAGTQKLTTLTLLALISGGLIYFG